MEPAERRARGADPRARAEAHEVRFLRNAFDTPHTSSQEETMVSFRIGLAALMASLASGCVGTLDDSGVGRIAGSLGEVSFAGTPEVREVRLDGHELHVDLRITGPDGIGAAMVGITIPHEGLDGEELVFHTEDARMIGCSGDSDGDWDFDCEPQEFFVDLYSGKEELGLDFEGRWTEHGCHSVPDDAPEGQPVDGYVDVPLI